MIKWRRKETNRNGEGSGMTHDEQRIWLIQRLLDEKPEYRDFRIPTGQQQQKDLLRALMNVRLPEPISEEILCGSSRCSRASDCRSVNFFYLKSFSFRITRSISS